MKYLVIACLLSCATTQSSYQEADSCPVPMTNEQHMSGVVRCRAMCSSYGRDMDGYAADCKCYCSPANKVVSF